ncbi:MAG: FAD-dependent oxidoreductase [Planctomycetota bacterium]
MNATSIPPDADVIEEPPLRTPVTGEFDVCVIGGSCTGVFAAVQAARMGASVALVEAQGLWGGVATAGLVNIWHSLFDTTHTRRIIGGLTQDVVDRLLTRGAAAINEANPSAYARLNSAELVCELDALIREHPTIRPFLHTRFVRPLVRDGRVTEAIVEDKTGRRAIRATLFIDASGDGDLLAGAGFDTDTRDDLQPPTVCAILAGVDAVAAADPSFALAAAVCDPAHPKALPAGFVWSSPIPGLPGLRMIAGTRVSGADCSDADQLTAAEMEGRRQARAMRDILAERPGGEAVALAQVASYIGIRETRHARCLYRLTERDLLTGVHFDDAIANGSYRVDVHHSDKPGLTFRYLDGREIYVVPGRPSVEGRWRESIDADPTFYQIPYRSLVPRGAVNVLATGRLIDADRGAYGAVRVMVNCNQTGQAAGAAAALAIRNGCGVGDVDARDIRGAMGAGFKS